MKSPTSQPHIPLDLVLKALGDPIRLSIVKELLDAEGLEKACGAFTYTVTKPTFSHHIKILTEAEIIQDRQDGTRKMISLRRKELDSLYPGLLQSIANS